MKLIEIRDDTFMFIRNKKTGVVLTKIKDDDNRGCDKCWFECFDFNFCLTYCSDESGYYERIDKNKG